MAYCRFSDGDVYLYHHTDGYVECCACGLQSNNNLKLASFEAAIEHLYQHRAAGHAFPEEAIEWLENDIADGKPMRTEQAGKPFIVLGDDKEPDKFFTVDDLIKAIEEERDAEDHETTAAEEKCPQAGYSEE